MSETLVVNLFGGPGTGKSTTAAGVFSALKKQGVNVELAHEWAKEAVWEGRMNPLTTCQTYVAGKQMYRVARLIGAVDVVITDSPILLSMIYKGDDYTDALGQHLLQTFRRWKTLNFLLVRDSDHHPYNPNGRYQSEDEAAQIDETIGDLLIDNKIPFGLVPMNDQAEGNLVTWIAMRLPRR